MKITESELRRRLATALNGVGLAEARAAGLELAPPFSMPMAIGTSKDGLYLGNQDPDGEYNYGSCGNFWAKLETESYVTVPMEDRKAIAKEAVRRYNAFPALEARAARLAAALGELIAIAEAAGGLEAERLRQALAEGRAALAEGGEP